MVMSVFADRFIEAAGISRTHLADAYLLGTVASGLLVSFGGTLFDRLGARPFFVLMVVLFGFAVMGMSQIDRFAASLEALLGPSGAVKMGAFVLGFFLIRFLGQGMVTIGARSMLSKWWNRKRGVVIALSGLVMAAGFSVAPLVLEWQVALLGWRGAWIANGLFLCTVMPVLAWIFFRDNPEECGLRMDGPYAGTGAVSRNADLLIVRDLSRGEAVRTYSFWVFTLGLAAQSLFATSYTFHVVDIGRNYGVGKDEMLSFFAFALFFSIPTNVLCGYISELIRLRFVLLLLAGAGAAMGLGILMLPDATGKWILIAGLGTSWGTYPVLSSVTFARYFGRTHLGAIGGMAMTFVILGSAVGPAVFARGQAHFGGYDEAAQLMVATYLAVGVASLFATNPQRRLAVEGD